MAGLRKILLFMLVFCTLGYGSAWAYDGHAVDTDDNLSVVVDVIVLSQGNQTGDQSSEPQTAVKTACDHCGHISAHLQAIFTQSGYLCSVNQSSELLEFSETFISFIVSPDLRPPRV